MNPLELLGGAESLYGVLAGGDAKRRAEAQRQALIDAYARELDQQYQNTVGGDAHQLASQAGYLGDGVAALGRRMGSSLAGAGVYNSSATAGALQGAEANAASTLANAGTQLRSHELDMLGANKRQMLGMQMGLANDNVGQARDQYSAGTGGMMSFLGHLNQYNQARNGMDLTKNAYPSGAGGNGNPSVLDAGAGIARMPNMSLDMAPNSVAMPKNRQLTFSPQYQLRNTF